MRHLYLFTFRPVYLLFSVLTPLSLCFSTVYAQKTDQKIDSIFFHLYTDSLKKGTFNYINVDGLLENGRYLPLDTATIAFSTSYGVFEGNNLWIPEAPKADSAVIIAYLKGRPATKMTVTLYIKILEETETLKTLDQFYRESVGLPPKKIKKPSRKERKRKQD